MRKLVISFTVAVVTFACGCQDGRLGALEKRVSDLEATVKDLQAEQKKVADARSQRDEEFKSCVNAADDAYYATIRGNGTKENSGYNVSLPVMQQIEREKQAKLEECKLLYK